MRILFMGTPDFAAVSLRRLVEAGHTVCGVFTQPDKPRRRGGHITPSPVKQTALDYGIPVFQPVSLRDGQALEQVQNLAPELTVVAAYGKILPENMLNVPPHGSINVHASLLPSYRGAAPINRAILDGQSRTGISIMYMAKELDAGDVILQRTTDIGEQEDALSLTERLAELGAEALLDAIAAIEQGTAVRTPQDESRKSYAPMLSREMSAVDWNRSAHEIHCQIRGLIPWPCAVTNVINGEAVKLYAAREISSGTVREMLSYAPEAVFPPPGTVLHTGRDGIYILCGDGNILCITELQAQNAKRMGADAWLRGHSVQTWDAAL